MTRFKVGDRAIVTATNEIVEIAEVVDVPTVWKYWTSSHQKYFRDEDLSPLPANGNEMVQYYLRAIGADGLCNSCYPCLCYLSDNDCPCGLCGGDCVPARLVNGELVPMEETP